MSLDLSLLQLFSHASLMVKGIMIILLIASVMSWVLILQKGRLLTKAKNKLDDFEFTFSSGLDLNKLYNQLSVKREDLSGLEAVFVIGFREFLRLRKQNHQAPQVVIEGVERAMQVHVQKDMTNLEQRLPFLATVQSMSPYIGLFGTVWGILHAFRALGQVQQATLAMVAPGISEALVATAMGLVAAIPAGIAYNRYIAKVDGLSNHYQFFMAEFINLLHRKMYTEGDSA